MTMTMTTNYGVIMNDYNYIAFNMPVRMRGARGALSSYYALRFSSSSTNHNLQINMEMEYSVSL
jgi:hypothetical protein